MIGVKYELKAREAGVDSFIRKLCIRFHLCLQAYDETMSKNINANGIVSIRLHISLGKKVLLVEDNLINLEIAESL